MFRRQGCIRLSSSSSSKNVLSLLQWTPPTDVSSSGGGGGSGNAAGWRLLTPDERNQVARRHTELLQEWRRHPMWTKSSCAQHFVDRVHQSFRDKFSALRGEYERCLLSKNNDSRSSSSGKCAVDVEKFREINEYLNHHHALEDDQMFPTILRRYPELKPAFDFLDGDHDHLHPLQQRVNAGDGEALVEFNQFLNDHLNREEMVLVPLALNGLLEEDERAGKFKPPAGRVGQS